MKQIYFFFLFLLPLSMVPFFLEKEGPRQERTIPEEESAESMNCPCTLTQGSFSSPLPFMSSNESVVDFYEYGVPAGSSANTGLELSNTLVMMLHENTITGEVSLVFIGDLVNDGSGGEMDITFNCMPNTAYIAVADEPGEITGSAPTFTADFFWQACCTDGGAIGGLGCGNTFTINPNIISGINDFSLVYGTPSNPTYIPMPNLNCPITIDCGGAACCVESFEFSGVVQNATCSNTNNGSVNLSTTCAVSPTFLWSNGATTEDLSNVAPGNYSVTITSNGCTQSANYIVGANNLAPQPSIIGPSAFCAGQTAVLSVNGSFSSYLWSNGQQTPSIVISSGGTYSVTVTSASGCSGTASTNVVLNPSPSPVITGPTSICFGNAILLSAGNGYASYQWSTGGNTPTILVTQPGGYSVTVTNSFGCPGTAFTVVQPLISPVPVITGPTSICPGESITLVATGNFSSYSWSTGQTTPSIQVSAAGIYSVTVTGNNGCTGSASVTVTESSEINLQISGDMELCPGDTTVLDAGPGYASYEWSTGDLTQAITLTSAGNYSVTVTTSGSCSGSGSATVIMYPADTVFVNGASCSPQDTGIFIFNYTNQYGCDSVQIETVSLLPSDSIFLFSTSCNPQDTGVFVTLLQNQFDCDSTVIHSVAFSEADSLFTFSSSCNPQDTGVFVLTLTNQYGCDSLIIQTVGYSESDTTFTFSASCFPQDTGVFIFPYTNQYGCDSIEIQTVALLPSDTTYLVDATCDPAGAGTFVTTLPNQYGCDSTLILTVSLLPTDTVYTSGASCFPQDTGVFIFPHTNQYGCDSIEIQTVALLPSDSTYLVDATCDPAGAGTFVTTLPNQYGCDSTLILTVSLLPTDTVYTSGASCFPQDTGVFIFPHTNQYGCDSIEIQTVFLLPSDTTYLVDATCNPAGAGTFVTTLPNQYGCDSTLILTVSLLPTDTVYTSGASCFPQDTGVFIFPHTNQYGCDSIEIQTVALLPSDTTYLVDATCDPAGAGTFVTTLPNQYGCDSTLILTVSLLPTDTVYTSGESCFPQDTGVFIFPHTNQYGCDSIEIQTVALLPSDTTYLFASTCDQASTGIFWDSYTNQYGCDSTTILEVSLFPPDSCGLTVGVVVENVLCHGDSNGSITLEVSGGNVPVVCNWESAGGALSGTEVLDEFGEPIIIQGLPAGTYTVQLADPNGLEWEEEIVIDSPAPVVATVSVASDYFGYGISCAGGLDGALEGEATGGVGGYSYIWSTGQSGAATLQNLGAGTYELTVTDANGCLATAMQTLNEPLPLLAELQVEPGDCRKGGSVVVTQISGGIPPYLTALDGGVFSSQLQYEDLSAGLHEITIEDAVSCTWAEALVLPEIPEYWADLGPDTVIALGSTYTLHLETNVWPADTIIWSPADCPDCLTVGVTPQTSTEYSVVVRDTSGCEATASVWVGVQRSQDFFVPNVISPNFDGINDQFLIYGGRSVLRVRDLKIYDRWGGKVFERSDFPPNDPAYGWDGRKDGEPVTAGVYVYQFEITYIDGLTLRVSGDVTIVR